MPTILEMTREELMPYVEALRKQKPVELTAEQIAQREELIQRARQAAEMLRQKYNVRRVVLFGSLVHEAWFHEKTDVDMAVEGGEGFDYFAAWGDVEKLFPDRKLDFIDWDMATDSLRNAINRKGLEL
jgi:predicted nucleotidyltransferase